MGDIIRFRPRQGARPETPVSQSGNGEQGSATILLFLGVRYERHEGLDHTPPKPHARRGGRKRA